MRIHVLSDLHIEFSDFATPTTNADLLVLAGDIGTKLKGLEYARNRFLGPTIYVAGNHEYYGGAIPRLTEKLHLAAQDTRVHFLENDQFLFQGTRFLGCTLWTDFQLLGERSREIAMLEAQRQMVDYRKIRKSPAYNRLRPADTRSLHLTSLHWLRRKLAEPFDGQTVVVTHHPPSPKSLDPRFPLEFISAAFASDLEELIDESPIDLWIHGHTHHCVDYEIGGTRIISNQRGYPDEDATGFDDACVITL